MSLPFAGSHIIFGASAAGSWLLAFHDNRDLFVHFDPLSCGPLKPCRTLSEWQDSRNVYLQSMYEDRAVQDETSKRFDLTRNAVRLRDYDLMTIWIGTGLEEQLLLLYTIFVLRQMGIEKPIVQVLLFESTATHRFPVRSMGELNPIQISRFPAPIIIDDERHGYCERLWNAVTSSEPDAIVAECKQTDSPLPAIPAALKYLQRRFPQKKSGLFYWDEKLLKNVTEYGPRAASIIGRTIGSDLSDGDLMGESYLFARLRYLANVPEPLVAFKSSVMTVRGSEVELTSFGRSVLLGDAFSLTLNPVDEWIGGVHVSSSNGNIWLYEDGNLIKADKT